MKKIKRPDSTTIILETEFHLIKDKNEFINMMKTCDKSTLKEVHRYMDSETFILHGCFEIKGNDSLFGEEIFRFVAPYQIIEN